MLTLIALAALTSPLPKFCADPKLPIQKIHEKIVDEVLPNNEARVSLIENLKHKNGKRCFDALNTYIENLDSGAEKNITGKGHLGLILLALQSDIPKTSSVVQKEILTGNGEDFLETLKNTNIDQYLSAISQWVQTAAKEIRQVQKESEQKNRQVESSPELTRIFSPLILDRYLNAVMERKIELSEQDFSDLNIIFASGTGAYRKIFLPLIHNALDLHLSSWVAVFRKEPVWIQVRLFSLIESFTDPVIVKELLWLSQNHPDLRIRTLADQSLDVVLKGKPKKTTKSY